MSKLHTVQSLAQSLASHSHPTAAAATMVAAPPTVDTAPRRSLERSSSSFSSRRAHGIQHAVVLVSTAPACRTALLFTRALLSLARCTKLTLVHCAPSVEDHEGMAATLKQMADALQTSFPQLLPIEVSTQLFCKDEDQSTTEAIREMVEALRPDLVFMASKSLCTDSSARSTGQVSGGQARVQKPAPIGASDRAAPSGARMLPQGMTTAMRLCHALSHTTPVLVFKTNTKGSFMTYMDPSVAPLKVLLDLQPTSRYMVDYVRRMLRPRKDTLVLAACKAYDATGQVKACATRLVTSFNVQAATDGLRPLKRLLKEGGEVALPRTCVEDDIDILAVQAPRCRDLSPYIIDLLASTPASVLIFPPDTENTALGELRPDLEQLVPDAPRAPAAAGRTGPTPDSAAADLEALTAPGRRSLNLNGSFTKSMARRASYFGPTADAGEDAAMDAMLFIASAR